MNSSADVLRVSKHKSMTTTHPLGRRVPILSSNNIFMKTDEALRLVAIRRAREVYSDSGEFLGIELGHFGPAPSNRTGRRRHTLAPSEVSNCIYRPPNSQSISSYRNCRALVRAALTFVHSVSVA